MKLFIQILVVFSICGVYSAVPHFRRNCAPPTGDGLNGVYMDYVENVPWPEVVEIYIKASATDRQFQNFIKYVTSKEYISNANEIEKSPEYRKFAEFACEKLYLEVPLSFSKYIPIITGFYGIAEAKTTFRRSGVVGFYLDVLDLVPFEKLEGLLALRIWDDESLREAIKNLKSVEFVKIAQDIENLPANQRIVEGLNEIGVDYNELQKVLYKFVSYIVEN